MTSQNDAMSDDLILIHDCTDNSPKSISIADLFANVDIKTVNQIQRTGWQWSWKKADPSKCYE